MALAVQLQLNPRAKSFVPTVKANKLLQHRRGKREEGEAPVSKHQTQLGRVRWASRRGEGEPNAPRETKNSGADGGRNWRTEMYVQKVVKRKKVFARKKRRRGKTRRRAARRQASNDRGRARRRELVIATHNVRTMAVDGKHGVGRAAEVLDVYQEMGCDIIDLQEARPVCSSSSWICCLLQRRVRRRRVREERPRWSWAGCSQEYLPCRSTTAGVHQRQATEGDARIVRSSPSCDVRCGICTNRHSICWKKERFLDSPGKGREGSTGA